MKKHFMTGIIVLLPLALTFWIVTFIINLLTTPFMGVAKTVLSAFGLNNVSFFFLTPDDILSLASIIIIILFLFLLIVGIGAIGRRLLFKYLIQISDRILHSIPVISTVYKTSQELIQTVLATKNKSFKQVVLVPFPTTESKSIGLVTRDDSDQNNVITVFVPTTPNPTSGFLIMLPKEQVTYVDMTVEEAFRYILSCGVLAPPLREALAEKVSE